MFASTSAACPFVFSITVDKARNIFFSCYSPRHVARALFWLLPQCSCIDPRMSPTPIPGCYARCERKQHETGSLDTKYLPVTVYPQVLLYSEQKSFLPKLKREFISAQGPTSQSKQAYDSPVVTNCLDGQGVLFYAALPERRSRYLYLGRVYK